MSIDLKYLLKRNKSSIKEFIIKNKLDTYENLLEYCNRRKILPISEEEYNLEKPKKDEPVEKQAEKKVVKRKTSSTQTKSTRRNRSKKVRNT